LKMNHAGLPALVLGLAALAHAQAAVPTKVAVIHIQNAILNTKDGQKAQQEMQARFNPKAQGRRSYIERRRQSQARLRYREPE
jgi:Skp family chaperone for outer membrane proteins